MRDGGPGSGERVSAIETPEEMAARLFPGVLTGVSTLATHIAVPAIRADREAIAAALKKEASAYEKYATLFERPGLAAGALALRAFADCLVPTPPGEPRPAAETGDPVAMAETSRPSGRTPMLATHRLDPRGDEADPGYVAAAMAASAAGQFVPPSSVCGEAPGRAEQLGRVLGAEGAPIQEEALAPALDREAPGAGHEYGIFSDEGLIEGGFYSRAAAAAALAARYQPDDGDVRRCCRDHPEHEADSCEECAEEPSCLTGGVVTRGDVGGGS